MVRRRLIGLSALALVSTAGRCGPPPVVEPPTMTVSIEVVDAATQAGLPDATVRYWFAGPSPDSAVSATTDAHGRVVFVVPASVTASHLWISVEGYLPAEQHVDARPGLLVRVLLAAEPPPLPSRRGLVRLEGRALVDDAGPFLGHGATLFWGLWGYQHDRERLEANLRYLAETPAIDHIRVLGTVGGPWWADRTIDPREPGYDAALAGLADLAFDRYGLRLEVTIFGGIDCTPTPTERRALVDRVLEVARGREHKFLLIEIVNEGAGNGFGGTEGIAELRALTRHANERTAIPVAASSYHEDPAAMCALYAGQIADVATMHFDRDISKAEGPWRPVRQPWGYPGELACPVELPPGDSNEPIGPFSSVAEERDPTRLIAQTVVAHIAGLPLSVIHTGPGIWGGGKGGAARGIPANLWETPGLTETLRGLAAVTAGLPSDLPAWSRQNSGWTGSPWTVDNFWPEGGDQGAVRVYSAVRGQAIVTAVIGVKRYVRLTARWPMAVDVIRMRTGDVVETRTLAAGELLRLEEDLGAWLLVSRDAR